MIKKELRELRAEEIEVRPAHKVKDKISMLLYIDSRAVTNYLDEWVGCMNWQSEFYEVNGQLMGKLGIWDDDKQIWVYKSDTGSESNIEKEKGLISDTYKRLLSRWGVTYLYTAPDILLDDDGYGNKGYRVSKIQYENKRITHLVIVNRFNKEVYRWDEGTTPQVAQNTPKTPSKSNLEVLTEFCAEKKLEENVNKDQLLKFYNYYHSKVGEWKSFNPQKSWEKWLNDTWN